MVRVHPAVPSNLLIPIQILRDFSSMWLFRNNPLKKFTDAFAALSPDHRVALALRYYADLPVEAIAELVGVPAGTVKSRIHVAVERMRDALGADEGGSR